MYIYSSSLPSVPHSLPTPLPLHHIPGEAYLVGTWAMFLWDILVFIFFRQLFPAISFFLGGRPALGSGRHASHDYAFKDAANHGSYDRPTIYYVLIYIYTFIYIYIYISVAILSQGGEVGCLSSSCVSCSWPCTQAAIKSCRAIFGSSQMKCATI